MLKLDPGDFAGTPEIFTFTPYGKSDPSCKLFRGQFYQIWRFDPNADDARLRGRRLNHVHGKQSSTKMASS